MVPEKYITQLIEDINAAHKGPNEKVSNNTAHLDKKQDDFLEYIQEVEDFLDFDDESEPTFGEVIEMEAIRFPKAELLTDDQMKSLLSAFYELVKSYNISIQLPDDLPLKTEYFTSLKILEQAIFLSNDGISTWDACESNSESCTYGDEFCYCLAFDAEFEQNIEYARELLNDIIEACEDNMQKHGRLEIEIGNINKDDFNLMCMYMASGTDYVPFEIYQNGEELEKACALLQKVFINHPDLGSAFQDISLMNVHLNLEVFLSLDVEKMEGNTIYVEPFYVDDGLLIKGHQRSYTPEELMDELESEEGDEV